MSQRKRAVAHWQTVGFACCVSDIDKTVFHEQDFSLTVVWHSGSLLTRSPEFDDENWNVYSMCIQHKV